jgi:hypothetical protein
MSKKDAVIIASRALSVVLTIWALAEISALPEMVYAFRHYAEQLPTSSAYVDYWHHHYLMGLGFLITRIIGYSLMARWLYKGGPEVMELLLPAAPHEEAA